ncbi:MAG: protoporphyrinogen oxidase HemJ [Arenicella sp.]
MYLWIKAFHIIAVICWFAAMFYLPRLFVYHAMSEDQISRERFKVMERKLYRAIMTPSMVATLALGFWLLSYGISGGWLYAKLALVALLVVYHFACGHLLKQFANDNNQYSHKFYRYFNEAPVLILITIVILVVVKPF